MHIRSAALLATLLAVWLGPAEAAMYKWIDDEGDVHYTQSPPPDRAAKALRPPGAVDTEGALKKLRADEEKANRYLEDRNKKAEERRSAEQKAAKKQAECARVRQNLEKLQTANRLYKTDADGNRIRLGEEERQAQIKKDRETFSKSCQP